MPYAAALSRHPLAADATGEVLGEIVERHGTDPDLVLVLTGGSHAEFLGEIVGAVRTLLRPGHVLAASSSAVLGGREEVEDEPGLVVWAAWFPEGVPAPEPLRLHIEPAEGGLHAVIGVPGDLAPGAHLVVLADPHTFPAEALVDGLAAQRPDVTVSGGLLAVDAPGGAVMQIDEVSHRDGAIGVVLPPGMVQPIVSQGCRPVGDPMVVTAADRNFLHQLAGRPALERLTELAETLPPDDRTLLARGVHLGIVTDETKADFARGDFLIRSVLGADQERGVLAVGAPVPVGTTVQFHVRDASSAADDLRDALADAAGDAALVFTCTGRGQHLFGVPSHDASTIAERLDTTAVAGIFCAGEIGPVGGRSQLHGFTASVVVLTDP